MLMASGGASSCMMPIGAELVASWGSVVDGTMIFDFHPATPGSTRQVIYD
jgi:hypothetical protein